MTVSETINAMKILLGMEKPLEVKFEKVILKDGSEISIDKLEVGGKVTVLDADGNEIPKTGDLELEDGSMLVVDTDGIITEIKEAVEAADIKVDEPEVDEPGMEETDDQKRISELEKQIAEIMKVMETMFNKNEKEIAEFSAQLKEIGNEPSEGNPLAFKKVEELKFEDMNAYQQFMYLRKNK